MMKRVLSFLLCVAIVVTMLPVQTIAMDEMTVPTEAVMESMEETATPMEEETTEPSEEENEPVEETTVPNGAETEPTDKPSTPVEEVTEPAEETTVPAEVETQPVEETTMPTEEALVIEEIEPVLADASEEAVVVEPFNSSIELYASTYGESGMAKFLFTPEVTAVYEFRSNSYSDSGKTGVILNSDGEELVRNAGEGDFLLYCELIAGQTYTLTADYTDENYTGEFSVILTRIHDLPLGELVESEITTGGEAVTYLFTPEETATYDFHMYVGETWGRARINDSQYNVIVSDYDYRNLSISCEMEAGETYIIESEFYYYDEVGTIPAYLTQVSELELGVEMDAQILLSDHESRYTFTPEETDIYAFHGFNADDSIEGVIYDSNGNHLGSAYGSVFTAYYQMQAGETYILIARYDNYNDYGVYSVQLSEVPELPFDAVESVTLGEPGETAVYKIAVDQTERYSIAAEGSYSLDVTLRSAEDGYLGCDYRYDGTKAEVVYTMEAGENYIFSVEYQDFGWTGTVDIFASVVHEYEEESSVAPPTCTTPGQRVFSCIHCSEEITEEIPAAHEYDDGACIHCDEPYIVDLRVGHNVYEPDFSFWEVEKAYYSFTPKVTESYSFSSSSGGDNVGYLYDSDWNLLTFNDDDEEGRSDFLVMYTLEAGKTYYLVTEPYQQGYGEGFAVYLRVNHEFETVTKPATCTVDGKIIWRIVKSNATQYRKRPHRVISSQDICEDADLSNQQKQK